MNGAQAEVKLDLSQEIPTHLIWLFHGLARSLCEPETTPPTFRIGVHTGRCSFILQLILYLARFLIPMLSMFAGYLCGATAC
jgi:hypothetical protein